MTNLHYDVTATEQLEAIYRGPDVARQRQHTLALLGPAPGEAVLDIGSGPGFLCTQIGALVGPSGKVRGVDISPVMVERASSRNPEHWITFAAGDATHLPEASSTYDAVVSIQVAEYVAEIDRFCSEAFRVLRPGGRALVMATDWDAVAWHSEDPERMRRVLAAFAPHCADSALPRTLTRHLREAGFIGIEASAYPILNHGWRDDSYSCRVIPFITSYIGRQSTLPREELDSWADEQRELGRRGDYYFLSCRVFFAAVKPW